MDEYVGLESGILDLRRSLIEKGLVLQGDRRAEGNILSAPIDELRTETRHDRARASSVPFDNRSTPAKAGPSSDIGSPARSFEKAKSDGKDLLSGQDAGESWSHPSLAPKQAAPGPLMIDNKPHNEVLESKLGASSGDLRSPPRLPSSRASKSPVRSTSPRYDRYSVGLLDDLWDADDGSKRSRRRRASRERRARKLLRDEGHGRLSMFWLAQLDVEIGRWATP